MRVRLPTTRKALTVVALPAIIMLFLLGYFYLGASKGEIISRFLLYTTPGNAILALTIVSCAYHITRNAISPATREGMMADSSLIEELHTVLFLASLALILYPVASSAFKVVHKCPVSASLALSLIISIPILLLFSEERNKLIIAIGYLIIGVLVVATFSMAGIVSESLADLVKLVLNIEMLLKELGVA
ncbi:MAG: hypothetical protein QW780_04605 [Sulfolobales archaeon]